MRVTRAVFLVALMAGFVMSKSAQAGEDDTFGTWSLGTPAPGHLLAVHSTLLRNGKILVIGGSSYNCCFTWGHEDARLYDIASGTWSASPLATPAPYGADLDAFCSAHVHDDRGGVIFQGGLLGYGPLNTHGIPSSARYDPSTGTFSAISGGIPHWYPTLVAGVDATFIFPGRGTQPDGTANCAGPEFQRLPYGGNAWTMTGTTMLTKATYPRVTLMPNGLFFIASPADIDRRNCFFNPNSLAITPAGSDLVPESEPGQVHCCESWRDTGVLLPLVAAGRNYPHMRFMLMNGIQSYIKDLGMPDPVWVATSARPPELGSPAPERHYANSTLLPTGQVLVTGGVRGWDEQDANAVLKPEVYDAETNSWLLTSPATVPRNYHGVALLLPDGRVWTASASQNHSGSQCGDGCGGGENTEERVEIFTPWYVGRPDRPVVTTTPSTMASDGGAYNIGIGNNGGASVGRVVLMRLGSATHSFDADQRIIQLDILGTSATSVTVRSPYSAAAAPPGDYMIFALRSISASGFKRWVPSVAGYTRVVNAPPPDGASIWRYVGPACTGEACPGWRMLDDNPKSMQIVAAGGHHEQQLYQLQNDGSIWRYTGTTCTNAACPGWQKLDASPDTTAIAAARSALYQLHADGSIWRYTGTPCSGANCPGWQELDNNPLAVAIAAGGTSVYELHNNGAVWRYTGTPCSGGSCPGWQRLDNNVDTVAITAAGAELDEMHRDGSIWRFTGTACSGDSCPGWQKLDNNRKAVAMAASEEHLYELHDDGMIWRYTGTPCSGDSCPGWQRLDRNSRTTALTASEMTLFQLHAGGNVWHFTGAACSGDSCPGWQRLDDNGRTGMIAAGDPMTMGSDVAVYQLHTDPLYQLHSNGAVWRYTGTECVVDWCPGWQILDNNATTVELAAAGRQLFQRHSNGEIWRYSGTPCNGDSCLGWQMLDHNPQTTAIVAGGNQLFQLHSDGSVWRSNGVACSGASCTGWQAIDRNSHTTAIAAGNTSVFQLHNDGEIWRYRGTPCSGTSCPGWERLDNNTRTRAIAAAGNQLFQLHSDGRLWRFTGVPCSGATCGGWQMLDNNAQTTAMAAAGAQLFQLHGDGTIWRYSGTPCSGTSCPGWEKLDNNGNTREIVAVGDHLYQRHADGKIWRWTGAACASGSCPGWQMLDNNPAAKRIDAGGWN
jgi:hypothetical protein